MRKQTGILLIGVLLLVAAAPWIAASCASRPLLPRQLREERDQYDAGVATAQQATSDARLTETPIPPKVVPIGTIKLPVGALSPTATRGIYTPTVTVTLTVPPLSPTATSTGTAVLSTSVEVNVTSAVARSTVKIVGSVFITGTATPVGNVTVRSTPMPEASAPPTLTASSAEITPTLTAPQVNTRGMVEVEDVITAAMLMAQVQRSIEDDSLTLVALDITPQGIRAVGQATLVGTLQQPLEMQGTFVVENESLVVDVTSVLLNGRDVTARYGSALEDEIRWQLYQMLPQRFVQSYTLYDGQIVVRSLKRP